MPNEYHGIEKDEVPLAFNSTRSTITTSTGETWQVTSAQPDVDPLLGKIFDFCERAEIGSPTYDPKEVLGKAQTFLQSEWIETQNGLLDNDILEIVDGFADQAFVAINGIYKALRVSGQDPHTAAVNANKILDNVAEANLAKGEPDFIYNEFGKVMKPSGWLSPDHSKECNIKVDNT